MGGSRCSYRNCSVRSTRDDSIHMFHFPVFDKPRCHQWITNAQKVDFLNLKLSQLKNKTICEYHFKDPDFMNHMKLRLKKNAIPTEDGPYCKKTVEQDDPEISIINLDDIENDHLTRMEKMAHLSVKYGDFLLNDVTEPFTLNTKTKETQHHLGDKITFEESNSIDIKNNKMDYKNSTLTDPLLPLYQNNIHYPTVMAIEYEDLKSNAKHKKDTDLLNSLSLNKDLTRNDNDMSSSIKKPPKTNSKVKIISEKKISKPVTLRGELQTVSPSIILKVPDKKKKIEVKDVPTETEFVNLENIMAIGNNVETIQPNVTGLENLNQCHTKPNQITYQDNYNDNPNNVGTTNNESAQNINHYVIGPIAENVPFQIESDSVTGSKQDSICFSISSAPYSNVPDISFGRTDAQVSHSVISSDDQAVNSVKKSLNSLINTPYTENTINVESSAENFANNFSRSCQYKTTSENNFSIENRKQSIISGKIKSMPNITTVNAKSRCTTNLVNKSLLKNKVPPERLAAIEEKRKYNMKLRDIVNSCLSKMEDETEAPKLQNDITNLIDKSVAEQISSDPRLPSSQENIISYIDARLKRLEDTLINKIDQNTNKIAELKRTINPTSSKKSTFTQTYPNINTKKHLFQQISQYLTPEVNSLLYEELFINQYSQKLHNNEPQKKRRKR